MSSDIHFRAISQEMLQPSVTKIRLNITYIKFHSNFPGANELRAKGRLYTAYWINCKAVHEPSQWETSLQSNTFHWLGANLEWGALKYYYPKGEYLEMTQISYQTQNSQCSHRTQIFLTKHKAHNIYRDDFQNLPDQVYRAVSGQYRWVSARKTQLHF